MSVTLNCEGTGRGTITYQWQTRNISEAQWRNIGNKIILIVSNLHRPQQYRCVVTNEAGETTSDVATVTISSMFTKCNDLMFRPESNMLKNLPKMLPGISPNFYLLCFSVFLSCLALS